MCRENFIDFVFKFKQEWINIGFSISDVWGALQWKAHSLWIEGELWTVLCEYHYYYYYIHQIYNVWKKGFIVVNMFWVKIHC